MTKGLRLEKRVGAADAFAVPGGTSSGALPRDVLLDASRRLGWAALAYSATYSLAFFGGYIAGFFTGMMTGHLWLEQPLQSAVAVTSILLGLAVFWLSRRSTMEPQRLLDLGLVFQVVGAFGIAVAELWGVFPEWGPGGEVFDSYVGVSWTCIWILVFPILAPNTPRKILIASLMAASMAPLVVGFSILLGATSSEVPLGFLGSYFLFTTYVCGGLAYFVARIVYRFGVQLREARNVGSYRLVERLGEGGMGEVWRAEHRLLVRPAAVKLIRVEALGREPQTRQNAVQRFEREAQATSTLRSVHTVELYDFGATDEGAFYYVMELLEGMNLETLVEEHGPLPADRTIYLLRQVCRSLGEAHSQGMIHRDIKPANIFTCHLGPDFDFVKVLDFGLVKLKRGLEVEDLELTAHGTMAGTPAFLAPEQAIGKGTVDARSDLYSLGCVAYWLLAGQRVFEAPTTMAMVLEHVRTHPVPPSRRSELVVPADLEAIVLQCLEKEPGDRPQSAMELEAALASCDAAGEWGPDEAEAWWRLHVTTDA